MSCNYTTRVRRVGTDERTGASSFLSPPPDQSGINKYVERFVSYGVHRTGVRESVVSLNACIQDTACRRSPPRVHSSSACL